MTTSIIILAILVAVLFAFLFKFHPESKQIIKDGISDLVGKIKGLLAKFKK